jgi:probable rRNA maturation factor
MSKHDSPRLRRGSRPATSPFDKPPAELGAVVVSLVNEQSKHPIDEDRLVEAVKAVLLDSPFVSASISLAVVDDATMHQLNRQYLNHDYPTDVLSFVLENDDAHLEGEVIISADTAATSADEFGWPAAAEQLLYVIHGTLHLVGHGDKSPDEIQRMRAAEEKYLRQFGFQPGCGMQDAGGRERNSRSISAPCIPHPSSLPSATSAVQRGAKGQ